MVFPDSLRFTVVGTDPEQDPISLSTSTLPANAAFTDFGDGTGQFSYSPDGSQTSAVTMTFYASDGLGQPGSAEVIIYGSASRVVSIRTAAADVLVIVVETEDGEATPDQNPALWTVDGVPSPVVGRWSYPWYEEPGAANYAITMRHHIYLPLAAPLVNRQTYAISTPLGDEFFDFDDDVTLCESLRTNQVGYSEYSRVRYANLGVYLGDLGPRTLPEPIFYEVIEDNSGTIIVTGQTYYFGDDTGINAASGEHVYRLDLSAVSAGGPYHVRVLGYGRSHSFGVGSPWNRELSYIQTRGLYHQRCGIALEAPYTLYTRGACHTTVEVTDAEPPDFIYLNGPSRPIRGDYHDAGDFDRRPDHTVTPAFMLNLYDAFPARFSDGQFDIPESGNGIPDWLDEALWGVLVWEELQEADGGVRAGTEADAHPGYARVNAETDSLVYRTYRRAGHSTASAAGLFAQASRLVGPFDPARAADLLSKAISAWQWVEANSPPSAHAAQQMYATLQLYLATADSSYHTEFLAHANYLASASYPEEYSTSTNIPLLWDGGVISPYFFAYLTTSLPTDPVIVAMFTDWLADEARDVLDALSTRPYPVGPRDFVGYGTATNQGRYAYPAILMYRLTGDQIYIDAASQLADYALGLNPLGKSYVTGLGVNRPTTPLQLDSYYTQQRGLGPVPGILIFGPHENTSSASYQELVWSRVFPAWDSLPEQRRYCEGWSLIRVQEFTTKLIARQACLYAFLDY